MPYTIAHDLAMNRFQTVLEGQTAALDYTRNGSWVVMTHVGVPPPIEGRGVASVLTKAALDWARTEQLGVVAQCPYVAAWIRRHPDYLDLLEQR